MTLVERLRKLLGVGGEEAPLPHPEDEECPACQSISCMEAMEKVYEYLDGELDEVSHRDVAHHFSVCKRCYPHLKLEERFMDLLHRAQTQERAPGHLRDQVLEVLAAEASKQG